MKIDLASWIDAKLPLSYTLIEDANIYFIGKVGGKKCQIEWCLNDVNNNKLLSLFFDEILVEPW